MARTDSKSLMKAQGGNKVNQKAPPPAEPEKVVVTKELSEGPKTKRSMPTTTGERYPATAKIEVLKKDNPHRLDSIRARAFDSVIKAKTVGDYEGKPKYLGRWVASGHIAIK